MPISTYLANAILDKVLRAVNFTVTTVYVSLHTGDPSTTGANEATAGGNAYARKAATFAAAASGATTTTADLQWLNMPGVTVTHVGLWDAVTSGNFLRGGALADSWVVPAGATFTLPTGDLDLTQT